MAHISLTRSGAFALPACPCSKAPRYVMKRFCLWSSPLLVEGRNMVVPALWLDQGSTVPIRPLAAVDLTESWQWLRLRLAIGVGLPYGAALQIRSALRNQMIFCGSSTRNDYCGNS